MHITVGHIIDNPTFDTEFAFRIVTDEEDGSWTDLYNSRETDDPVPTFLLIENVTFMTIIDNQLILEVRV